MSAVRRLAVAPAGLLAMLLLAGPARAHSIGRGFGDFYTGVLHPLTALEHLLPLLALSLLAGQQGSRTARWVVPAFPLGLLAGAGIAALDPSWTAVRCVDVAAFVLLGVAVAAALRVPAAVLAGVAAVLGVAQGYENALGLPAGVARTVFALGVACSGLVSVTLIAAGTLTPRVAWVRVAIRVAGSWIAAIGLLMLGVSVSTMSR